MSREASSSLWGLRPMTPRDPDQEGRTATVLELFFDLVFVVAVSIAAVNLHHFLVEGHVLEGLGSYLLVFFSIWWAWMNFTWFATSFDTDDWVYRLLTFGQMAGVLVLAAGIGPSFEHADYTVLVSGYVIMRIAMVTQWLRASRVGGTMGRVAKRYAFGILLVQVGWVAWLLVPAGGWWTAAALLLVAAELCVPVYAESAGYTPKHPHHITERYGLFTIILLGESLLALANAVIEALEDTHHLPELLMIAVLVMVVTCGMWWIYFWAPHHHNVPTWGFSARYGYVHYAVFAAAGAFSAGVEVEIAQLAHGTALTDTAAAYTVAVPVALFILGVWWVVLPDHRDPWVNAALLGGAALILLDPLLPVKVALTAVIMAGIVAILIWREARQNRGPDPEETADDAPARDPAAAASRETEGD